jgi:hypothetical protein
MMGKLVRYAFVNIAFVRCQANVSHGLSETRRSVLRGNLVMALVASSRNDVNQRETMWSNTIAVVFAVDSLDETEIWRFENLGRVWYTQCAAEAL